MSRILESTRIMVDGDSEFKVNLCRKFVDYVVLLVWVLC